MLKQLYKPTENAMRVAAFMSGTGTNLKKILETKGNFDVVMVFSDNPHSNARRIAGENGVAYYCSDIREFYKSRGHADRKDMELRKEYDRQTVQLLQKHNIDVVALCGYMSVVSGEICDKYLTINVHPADLRILDNHGKRIYANCMGEGCIKKVLDSGVKESRSTTHIVTTTLDGGPVLLVSDPVRIDGSKGLADLKRNGDWKIYPETVKRLAEGRFWMDEGIIIDLFEEKSLLREKLKDIRERLDENDVKEKSLEITKKLLELPEYKDAKSVMFYMSVNKEVITDAMVRHALQSKKVMIPVSDLDNQLITPAHIKSMEELKPGAYGILEPIDVNPASVEEIDLIILPGLAFDGEGNRLGYGLGFYDKFLQNFKGKKTALAYEAQIVDKVRTTDQDIAVDKIITEERVIECVK